MFFKDYLTVLETMRYENNNWLLILTMILLSSFQCTLAKTAPNCTVYCDHSLCSYSDNIINFLKIYKAQYAFFEAATKKLYFGNFIFRLLLSHIALPKVIPLSSA
jgi:hypothetical protein